MKLNETAKKLRMLLYGKQDCEGLCKDFEKTLRLCGCDEFQITTYEDEKVLIVDAYPCIQYIKKKGPTPRIYEVIPEDSPLLQYSKRSYYDKRTKTYAKETLEERRLRLSA